MLNTVMILVKIKKAIHDNAPYDLLISDLSFKADHRENASIRRN
jgi:hypothetical protein